MEISSSKHLSYIDLLRSALCLSVLFYHLDLIKGGFLAVCGFFVLSGYFLTASLDRESFNLIDHYKKRFKKLYLPLVIIVFSVILLCHVTDVYWVTIKPETTSILAGYNNYYHISIGDDYFARSDSSPFLHLWYISVLLQFELIYPLVFCFLRFLNKKMKKIDHQITALFVLVTAVIFFYVRYSLSSISAAYYGSPERISSFAFGIFTYFMKKNSSESGNAVLKKTLFIAILSGMTAGSFFVSSESSYVPELMILYSLFTAVLIGLASDIGETDSVFFKPLRFFASFTYEIYLIHYPVITVWNALYFSEEKRTENTVCIILISLAAAYVLHTLFNVTEKSNPLLILMCCVLGFVTVYGGCLYANEKDHTEEMEALRQRLALEEEDIKIKQQAYIERLSEENEKWEELLLKYSDEDYADKSASAVRVCGIGDSVMLGASFALYERFPNFYCDAVVSRPGLYVRDIMASMKQRGILKEAVLVHIGSNGGLWEQQTEEIVNFVNSNSLQLFWVTVTNDRSYSVYCNDNIRRMCEKYDNIHLIDWEKYSYGHGDWMVSDGVHMTQTGAYYYADLIYKAIHGYYEERFENERQDILNAYDESENERYSFYGGDFLADLHELLSDRYDNAAFTFLQKEYGDDIVAIIRREAEKGTIARNVIILTDESFVPGEDELKYIAQILEGRKLTLVSMADQYTGRDIEGSCSYLSLEKILGDEYIQYLYADRIHLNERGMIKAVEIIAEELK